MPRRISVDGKTYVVPDDATDDEINHIVGPAPTSPAASPQSGFLGSFADSSGLSGLGHAIAHPIDTLTGIPAAATAAAKNAWQEAHQEADAIRTNGLNQDTRRMMVNHVPIAGPALKLAQSQHDAGNDAGMAGTMAGTIAGLVGPEALKAAIPAVGRGIATAGEAAQDSGIGVLNQTIGTLKNDFKRGANPAKAYFEAGGGPSLSMGGFADKASTLKSSVGKGIASAYAKSPAVIPAADIAGALQPPLTKAADLATGPGGTGSLGPIEDYAAQFRPTLKEAVDKGGLTPSELFGVKKSIAQNTAWSDPTQFNLKSVRQQQTGALGGLLEKVVPEVAPLNSQFQGLSKFADRATSRAETGSMPLTSLARQHALGLGGAGLGLAGGAVAHSPLAAITGGLAGLAMDSVPVKSALASGLYYGGRGADALGSRIATLPPLNPALVAPAAYSLIRKNRKDEEDK